MTSSATALAGLFGLSAGLLASWLLARQDGRLMEFRSPANRREDRRAPSVWESRWIGLVSVSACMWAVSAVSLPEAVRTIAGVVSVAAGGNWLLARQRAKAREVEMKSEWPALLEGMAVATLSGLDLTAAFLASARRTSGALREETDRAAVRLAGGTQLSRALLIMAKGGVPGADRLRSLLLRCEVLGTPVAEVLQTLAIEAATVERQEIEGRFIALPLKLSVVTVLFLLPPVLIVSITPHILLFLNSRW